MPFFFIFFAYLLGTPTFIIEPYSFVRFFLPKLLTKSQKERLPPPNEVR